MAIIRRLNRTQGIHYQVKVRDSIGRWFPTKTFQTKADAERYERELLSQKDVGSIASCREQRQITLDDYWHRWKDECRNQVSEGWKGSQDVLYRKYVLPALGQARLLEIRTQDIGRLLGKMEQQGFASQSILHVYNLLHKMFRDAVEFYELLDSNPVRQRFRPKLYRVERNFLSPTESWRLLEVARHHRLGAAIWVSMLSGLLPGEVQALRWNAIDFDHSQILIRATFNRKTRALQEHPKQKDWGRAPMPAPLAEYLRGRSIGRRSDDFVCPNALGNMLCYESFVVKVLPKLCDQAGVPRITPHELRHSCTELYVQEGASAEDLRRLLNHKSLSATIRYVHRTDERLSGLAARIREPVQNPTPPSPALHEERRLKLVHG